MSVGPLKKPLSIDLSGLASQLSGAAGFFSLWDCDRLVGRFARVGSGLRGCPIQASTLVGGINAPQMARLVGVQIISPGEEGGILNPHSVRGGGRSWGSSLVYGLPIGHLVQA